MACNDSWPFLEGPVGVESDAHVQLKNLAIYWLLQRGFSIDDIDDEHYLGEKFDRRAYTDIYATDGSVEVYIECEVPKARLGDLSGGGSIPAKKGEAVYYFDPDGIYRLRYKPVTVESTYSGEPITSKRPHLERYQDLPALDLPSFKD